MSGPLQDAVTAYFDYLNTKSSYTALGLTEFKRYDGKVLPENAVDLAYGDVPAHAVLREVTGTTEVLNTVQIRWTFRLELGVVFRASGRVVVAPPSTIEDSFWAIMNILSARDSRQTRLGSSAITDYTFGILSGAEPIVTAPGDKGVAYWLYKYFVDLVKDRTIAKSS